MATQSAVESPVNAMRAWNVRSPTGGVVAGR